jgi:chromosome segregation ATPase
MNLNYTREKRDVLTKDDDFCIAYLAQDCNALEDELARVAEEAKKYCDASREELDASNIELARVREELESARRVIERARESADAEKEGHWGNYKGISSVEALRAAIVDHRERFGGRDDTPTS